MPTLSFHRSALGPAITVDEPDGGPLVDICDDIDAPVAFSCRGASCGTCRVEILTGSHLLTLAGEDERDVLDAYGNLPNQRLACCAQVVAGPGHIELRAADEDELRFSMIPS